MDRVFGTVVGWLIGLGMVGFAIVGFSAINQATPLSSSHYLAGAAAKKSSGQTKTSTSTSKSKSSTSTSSSKSSKSGKSSSSSSSSSSSNLSQAQLVSMAQTIIQAKCMVCHVINGKGGNIGPNLDEVMAGKTVPKMVPGGKPTNAAWLSKWIANPQAVWSSAIMPNLGLNPTQVKAVVTYLTTKVK